MPVELGEPFDDDDVVYPVDESKGKHTIEMLILETLRPMVARYLEKQKIVAQTGCSQFFYWERGNPAVRIDPDFYLLPGVPPARLIGAWKTWEEGGIVPSLTIEIVGLEAIRDYEELPALHGALGVRELIVFDPRVMPLPDRIRRFRFQVYRHTRSGFERVLATDADRVHSTTLDAWLRDVGEGCERRLRVATGVHGDDVM